MYHYLVVELILPPKYLDMYIILTLFDVCMYTILLVYILDHFILNPDIRLINIVTVKGLKPEQGIDTDYNGNLFRMNLHEF